MESIETLALLREYLDKGFLLHGSKNSTEMLEPRQSSDSNEARVSGKQFAIYAADNVEVPIFMALRDKRDPGKRSMHSGYSGYGGTFHMYGENIDLTPGYVYVLPRDTFETESDGNGDEELISRVPIKPVAIVPIEPDIVHLLGTISLDLK